VLLVDVITPPLTRRRRQVKAACEAMQRILISDTDVFLLTAHSGGGGGGGGGGAVSERQTLAVEEGWRWVFNEVSVMNTIGMQTTHTNVHPFPWLPNLTPPYTHTHLVTHWLGLFE
jgi:hypothetical protein